MYQSYSNFKDKLSKKNMIKAKHSNMKEFTQNFIGSLMSIGTKVLQV
jgi:hypothetical protein